MKHKKKNKKNTETKSFPYLTTLWTIITAIASLLAYTIFVPSLSLTNGQTNHESVLSAKFLLSNDGLWFSVKNVAIRCTLTVTDYKPDYNGPKLQSSTNASSQANVHELKSKEKVSDSCQFAMIEGMPKVRGVSGISLTPKEILTYATKAHLAVSVTYTPFFQWPLEKKFPFSMALDRELVYWTEEPLEHYESAMKQLSNPKN